MSDKYNAMQDPQFQSPAIDGDRMDERVLPDGRHIPYRRLHGSFQGTAVKFMICLPEKEQFRGHFFMHISPFPGPDEEIAALPKTGEDDMIAFAVTHGAGYVECNMGSSAIFGTTDDSSIYYRSNAAAAQYAKKKISELYGCSRVYAYAFGGSGGGYKTMSCIENTTAFDGAVPFVIGSPISLPDSLTVAANGARMLRNCWQKIVDALEPGGSGNPYEGLNEEETAALHELENWGYPLRMCIAFGTDDDGALPVLAPTVHQADPAYFADFWTEKGYAGAEKDGSARRDLVHLKTRVVNAWYHGQKKQSGIDDRNGTDSAWQKMMAEAGDAGIIAEDVPGKDAYIRGVTIRILSGNEAGKNLHLDRIEGKALIPGAAYGTDDYKEVFDGIRPGDEILLDNSDYIAIMHYHRHQVPDDRSFHCFDQYRNPGGTPALPQRPSVISFGFTKGGCGSVQSGDIQGNVIVMNSLMDGDFPWSADWYLQKVKQVKGEDAKIRLYYNDSCPHGDATQCDDPYRQVSYLGMLRQALLDLADWTEKGILPRKTTGYDVKNQQVILKTAPEERCGLQPIAKLLADGKECIHVKAGEKVTFTAEVFYPEGTGSFESADFHFGDDEGYSPAEKEGGNSASHVYEKPGTYFAACRIITNRNPGDIFTRLRNLARARVIVE